VRDNVREVLAMVLFVAIGAVLWVQVLLMLLVAVDMFFGFHTEVLGHPRPGSWGHSLLPGAPPRGHGGVLPRL